MSFRSVFLASLAGIAILGGVLAKPAYAADLFWSANGTSQGGAGTWNTADARWGTVAAGPYGTIWDNANNDTAIFGSTAGAVALGTDITAGALTFNTTGYSISAGNTLTLAGASTPIINVTTGTTTINSIVAGTDGLQKNGAGVLALTSTSNSFSGGLIVNGGQIHISDDAQLGDGSNGIRFTATGMLQTTVNNVVLAGSRTITVDSGANAVLGDININNNPVNFTVNGRITGLGGVQVGHYQLGTGQTFFNSTSNDFAGALILGTSNDRSYTYSGFTLNIASLADDVGHGNIIFGRGNGAGANAATFAWSNTATSALVLDHRRIELDTTVERSVLANNNVDPSKTVTVNTDLLISRAGNKTFELGGTNVGLNAFNGVIADSGTPAAVISLNKSGTGTWALGGTNSYTGNTTVSGGMLIVSGTGSTNTGAYAVTGATILRGTTPTAFGDAANISIGGSSSLQLRGDSSATFGKTTGGTAYTTSITATAATINVDRNTVAGTNQTFTLGAMTISSTAATVNTTISGANNTSLILGAVTDTTAASGTVQFTNSITGGGSLTLASFTGTRTGTPTLTFSGAGNTTVTGAISQTGTQALNYNGTGILTLGGTNTYTGATTVTGGRLLLSSTGSLAAGSAVTVSGGSIGGTGTVNGAVTVSSTGGLNLRDNAIGVLTLGSTLDITGAAGANNLFFDLGNGTGTSDSLSVAGNTTVTTTGAAVVNLTQLGGTAGRTATTYTLIGGAGTLDATNFAKFSLATTAAFGQTYTLTNASDGLQVVAANVTSVTPAAFWAGGGNDWSTTGNWRASLAGNDGVAGAPDYQTNVTFSTTTPVPANLTTNVLDVDFNINSLTFANASNNVTIGGAGRMLTIEAAAVNGNAAGNGIDSRKTSGTNTISVSRIGLASSQTWTVATGGTLAVSGVISDFGGGYSLTKAGGGTLTISTAPTYTGATIINGGTLNVSGLGANPLSTSSGLVFTGSSTFIPTGAQPNYTLPSTTIDPGVTAIFLPSPSGNNTTFAMESLSGAGTFDIQTSGSGAGKNIVFNSLSSFTGVLQHTQGGGSSMGFTTPTLNDTVASNIRFAGGASPAGSNNFRFIYNGSDGMTLTNRAFELAYSTGDFEIRNNGSANSAFTINSNLAVTAAGAKALRLSGTNTNGISTFAGTITNGSGTIGVTKADANTWSLTNANNTFTGTITMSSTTTSAGTLSYASAGGANPISFLQTTGSATLSYTGSTDKTMSGAITANALTTGTITLDASGSGAINYSNTASLGSAGSGNKNLILSGANTGNNTLAGAWVNNTGGVATLTKNGAGTWILTGTNTYTGATTVNAGTLLINGDNSGATGPITVAAGAYLGGSGDIGGNLSFAATSLFEIVDINTPLAVSGTVTFGSGFGIANLAGLDWDSLDLNSPYTLISTTQTFTASDIANFGLENAAPVGTGRSAYFQSGSLQLVVVPEPTTMALLGAGVALLGLHVARRRKA